MTLRECGKLRKMDKKQKNKSHYLWILCTKWGQEMPDKRVLVFWTPFGTKGKLPLIYSTKKEATEALKEIADMFPKLEDRKVCALHVRYAPTKVKVLKKKWFDKYVIEEVMFDLKDKSKKQEVLNDGIN